jgi:hypothetical protein
MLRIWGCDHQTYGLNNFEYPKRQAFLWPAFLFYNYFTIRSQVDYSCAIQLRKYLRRNNMKKRFSFLAILVLTGLLVSGLAFAFPNNVLAMEAHDPVDDALSRAYTAEQSWLLRQQDVISKADQAAADVDVLIQKASAEGLDVTTLRNALNVFNTAMATVKADHQSAADTLTAHGGFDAGEKVTDRQDARQTVLDSKQAFWQVHVTMVQALSNLHQAVRDWRQATFPQ